ncbi:MAG TPA: hypothetical protein VG675_03790 [Bryobacteraceae bacterium]|nr:hypothetical protein [Bryobacteraceae bacterium]
MAQPTQRRESLRSRLTYEPKELRFGTSGRRGEVAHLTQLEVYINALAELEYLQLLLPHEGGIGRGDEFYLACDLRPSSTTYVAKQQGRGEIAQALWRAVEDARMCPVNLGRIPAPALMNYAIARGCGSIMVTGSHIPFDRNGYKLNTSRGELLKRDEAPIDQRVRLIRAMLYDQLFADSLFDEAGLFKTGHRELPPENDAGRLEYVQRYENFFQGQSLQGMRLVVYQHSAVGRDLLADILRSFGAEVIPAGRSETFVPIDTENIDDAQLAKIQALADETAAHGRVDAVVSTDGDSDRPLIVGVDPKMGQARFFGGDLLGMVVAEYLCADAAVVPVSCNDAVDRWRLKAIVEPKTRIGSPFVLAGMEQARAAGKRRVCGWEANGGFLTASDFERDGKVLKALPTRDALLPILCVLFAAREQSMALVDLFARLPKRYSRSALLREFPRPVSQRMVEKHSPGDLRIREAIFGGDGVRLLDANRESLRDCDGLVPGIEEIRTRLEDFFPAGLGFGSIVWLDFTDGVRIGFSNGDVAHFRPSGNADELRIYAVADTQERADAIAEIAVAEPEGILRRMERAEEPST